MAITERGTQPGPPDPGPLTDTPTRPAANPNPGDRVFRFLATAATLFSLVIVVLALVFLVDGARPALSKAGLFNFFFTNIWNPSVGRFGVFGLLLGTIIIAAVAMTVALPLAIGMALFINEYAPFRLARVLTSVVDLLAALPSLLF